MNQSFENTMRAFGDAIVSEVSAAKHEAESARAELQRLQNGLRSLIGQSQDQESDDRSPAAAVRPSAIDNALVHPDAKDGAPKNRTGRTRVSDEALLDALSFDWSTAAQLRKVLLDAGFKISDGSIYNRTRKLAAAHPELIETAIKPERWRKKESSKGRNSKKQRKGSADKKPTSGSSKALRDVKARAGGIETANEDPKPLHLPVLHHGDCFEVMRSIEDASVDLILADLPYGTTRTEFDVALPLEPLWQHYRRILKPRGAVVLFGSQPFTTKLAASNPRWFKYALVWEKSTASGFFHAKNKPLKSHEDVLVFSPGTTMHASLSNRCMTYNPQGLTPNGTKKLSEQRTPLRYLANAFSGRAEGEEYEGYTNYPRSVLSYPKDGENLHPFQKPIALLEYLIRTYSNEGELVLDNTMGSGTTCVAAMRTGRRSIGIEQSAEWFKIAEKRVEEAQVRLSSEAASSRDAEACHNDNDRCAVVASSVSGLAVGGSNDNLQAPAVLRLNGTTQNLHQGDCLDVMRTLPSGSVDLVFTSPPYNLGWNRGGFSQSLWPNAALAEGYASYDDAREPAEYIDWQKEVLRECWRLLSPTGAIFYNHKPRVQNGLLQTPLDLNPDLPLRQVLIWNRGSGHNFNRSFFVPSHEWIVVFAKPGFRLKGGKTRGKDVWDIRAERNNSHPAPFPVELAQRAIAATSAKIILDPFMGSGTTGVAALREGRDFIGIEIDPGYVRSAEERIKNEAALLVA